MKPLIGINLDIRTDPRPETFVYTLYLDAIRHAGGIPLLLPPMPDDDLNQFLPRLSGLVLIGGDDYSPAKYGQSAHKSVSLVNPSREDFDFRLVKKALEQKGICVLGICNGCELLNIHLGGTLIQDIKTQMPSSKVVHTTVDGWRNGWNRHDIKIKKDSHLFEIYGSERLSAITAHHQGLDKLGKNLTPGAFSEDGLVEAVELAERDFVIGVLWHPERDYAANKKLFERFIEQSQKSIHKSAPGKELLSQR